MNIKSFVTNILFATTAIVSTFIISQPAKADLVIVGSLNMGDLNQYCQTYYDDRASGLRISPESGTAACSAPDQGTGQLTIGFPPSMSYSRGSGENIIPVALNDLCSFKYNGSSYAWESQSCVAEGSMDGEQYPGKGSSIW